MQNHLVTHACVMYAFLFMHAYACVCVGDAPQNFEEKKILIIYKIILIF